MEQIQTLEKNNQELIVVIQQFNTKYQQQLMEKAQEKEKAKQVMLEQTNKWLSLLKELVNQSKQVLLTFCRTIPFLFK